MHHPRNAVATRERILDAARVRFTGAHFDAVTIRDIAGDAGVDAALIKRYFGSKQQLFAAAFQPSIDVDEALDLGLAGLVRHVLSRIDEGVHQAFAVPFVGEPSDDDVTRLGNELVSRLSEPIAARVAGIDPSDAERRSARLRADLMVSVLVGIGYTRNVLRVDAMTDSSLDEIVDQITPALRVLSAAEQLQDGDR
ncbi:MAG: TetR family transcriptional regulator [Ilumatobacteraceae bacterium]